MTLWNSICASVNRTSFSNTLTISMINKLLYILILLIILVNAETSAATREEIAAINVPTAADFQYWTNGSSAKNKLIEYVEDVTNPSSQNFIPVEDRIAVFDCDGTLICETAPYYFGWTMYLHHVLEDKNYNPSTQEADFAARARAAIHNHNLTSDLTSEMINYYPKSYADLTPAEFSAFVKNYINNNYVEGLGNLKVGEAFYLPMVEVVAYLNANGFTVYIVSGCERESLRALIDGALAIKPNHIIGSDHSYKVVDGHLIRSGSIIDSTVGESKIIKIQREIGRQPVLAFGNSSGDFAMLNYTINNNKYKSAAFILLCDDTEREFGNLSKAAKTKAAADNNGWIAVSMRNDFKTIYGYDILKY